MEGKHLRISHVLRVLLGELSLSVCGCGRQGEQCISSCLGGRSHKSFEKMPT